MCVNFIVRGRGERDGDVEQLITQLFRILVWWLTLWPFRKRVVLACFCVAVETTPLTKQSLIPPAKVDVSSAGAAAVEADLGGAGIYECTHDNGVAVRESPTQDSRRSRGPVSVRLYWILIREYSAASFLWNEPWTYSMISHYKRFDCCATKFLHNISPAHRFPNLHTYLYAFCKSLRYIDVFSLNYLSVPSFLLSTIHVSFFS